MKKLLIILVIIFMQHAKAMDNETLSQNYRIIPLQNKLNQMQEMSQSLSIIQEASKLIDELINALLNEFSTLSVNDKEIFIEVITEATEKMKISLNNIINKHDNKDQLSTDSNSLINQAPLTNSIETNELQARARKKSLEKIFTIYSTVLATKFYLILQDNKIDHLSQIEQAMDLISFNQFITKQVTNLDKVQLTSKL